MAAFCKTRYGSAMSEYAVLIAVILAAFILMAPYLLRGIAGYWKEAGDSFGYGRIYDPERTVECAYSPIAGAWYRVDLYEECANNLDPF